MKMGRAAISKRGREWLIAELGGQADFDNTSAVLDTVIVEISSNHELDRFPVCDRIRLILVEGDRNLLSFSSLLDINCCHQVRLLGRSDPLVRIERIRPRVACLHTEDAGAREPGGQKRDQNSKAAEIPTETFSDHLGLCLLIKWNSGFR